MKNLKLCLFAPILLFFFNAQSQVFVDGVNINDLEIRYVEVEYIFGSKAISLDYGQLNSKKNTKITDKSGDLQRFRNLVALLNFMDFNGWELLLPLGIDEGNQFTNYIFQRKKG